VSFPTSPNSIHTRSAWPWAEHRVSAAINVQSFRCPKAHPTTVANNMAYCEQCAVVYVPESVAEGLAGAPAVPEELDG